MTYIQPDSRITCPASCLCLFCRRRLLILQFAAQPLATAPSNQWAFTETARSMYYLTPVQHSTGERKVFAIL